MIHQALKNKNRYLDFRFIAKQILKYWYLFVTGLFIGLLGAVIFNRMAIPKFRVSTKVLVFTDDKTVRPNPYDYFKGLRLFSPTSDLHNEILFLKSTPIIVRVIKKLDLTVSYFHRSKRKYQEIYTECPFKIYYNNAHKQVVDIPFYVRFINENQFQLQSEHNNVQLYDFLKEYYTGKNTDISINKVYNIGEEIITKDYSFSLLLKEDVNLQHLKGKEFAFQINSIQNLAQAMKKDLSAGRDADGGTLVNVSFKSESMNKATDVLNVISDLYLESRTERMSELVSISLKYIDDELEIISDSLRKAEWEMQDLKRRYNLNDVETKTMDLYTEQQQLENQLAIIKHQHRALDQLLNYLETKNIKSDSISISLVGIYDDLLTTQAREFMTLISERKNLEAMRMTKSPYYKKTITALTYSFNNIKDNIKKLKRANEVSLRDLENRIAELSKSLFTLPNTQLKYLNIERRYMINEELYGYLHEKRSEAIITKTGKLPKVQIVEEPKPAGKAYPNDFINYITGIFLGIYFPGLIVWLRTRFGKKIEAERELTHICQLPVIGKIPLIDAYVSNRAYPYYYVEEAVKNIRTSLDYFLQGEKGKVLAITSATSGDGKTFFSTQISKSFSELGLKVLIIGFDLRNPSLQREFDMKSILGVSEYIINKANIDDIIQPTNVPNLFAIFPGNQPPNASDLLASDKVKQMINILKEDYDYIFLDTAPMALVPDAKPLLKITDFNFLVVRLHHTHKNLLYDTIEEIEEKYASNTLIVFNGLNGLEDKLFSNPIVSFKKVFYQILTRVKSIKR